MSRKEYLAAVLSFGMAIAWVHGAWAATSGIEPAAKIVNVVVFSDSAMIKKEARFSLQKGDNIVRIPDLTPQLVDPSVQVTLAGKSSAKISEVKVEETHLRKAPPEKIQNLQSRREQLDERMGALAHEISIINNSSDFLKKIMPFPRVQRVTPAEVEDHTKFLEKTLAENHVRIAKIEANLKRLKEEKSAVENELKSLRSPEKSKIIECSLVSPEAQEVTLAFSYVVNSAAWAPLYEVKADSNAAKINLDFFVTIRQDTGEDWADVNVEISTAKPYSSKPPGDLYPWQVDVYRPRPPAPVYARQAERSSMSAKAMEERPPESAPAFEVTQVKAETTSFSFLIPRKISIPADRQPHRVLIASSEKETDLAYDAVPKLSPYAYLQANYKNPFTFPLLAGRMNIFLDGRLVSNSPLGKTILPGDDLKISLGVDEAIKVERKLRKKFTESAGLLAKGTRVKYEYAHELANGKGKEIAIAIHDHFPVSKNENIKVDLEAPRKEEAEISAEGIINWKIRLAAGEKKSLQLKFSVEYPKELTVTGLE